MWAVPDLACKKAVTQFGNYTEHVVLGGAGADHQISKREQKKTHPRELQDNVVTFTEKNVFSLAAEEEATNMQMSERSARQQKSSIHLLRRGNL